MVANQNEDRRYGCGPIKLSCTQRLNSIRWHVFWQCIFTFFDGFIVSGVVNVIIPALEKRYELSSSKSAIIVSANDFGAFVLLIFLGYFGERRHKPKLMGAGILLMAFGCLVFSLPQFIGEKYAYTISGLTLCSDAVGVATGYIVGGSFLNVFVDVDKLDVANLPLTSSDPQWVGAWWIGFIIAVPAFILVAFPILGYPRRLPGYEELQKQRKSEAYDNDAEEITAQASFVLVVVITICKANMVPNPVHVFDFKILM
ncbi:Hypothetical predicted protein [Mytilus galloprovincialis]|uniref:Uncharacterized protein n=1 Tax=Mytilus galloprovincialis TaxID=29158 RepID=A0A8B6F8P1_MYTGA|nr:Hypothetical predicted protein [Mytilus galloprovincialis]